MYMRAQLLSQVQLFVTPWNAGYQAPLFMGFSRQEYWSGLLFLPPVYLPNPETEPVSSASPALQVGSLPMSYWESPYVFLTIHRNKKSSVQFSRSVSDSLRPHGR